MWNAIYYCSFTTGLITREFNSLNTQILSILAFKFSRKVLSGQGPAGAYNLWTLANGGMSRVLPAKAESLPNFLLRALCP